jgi:hypothetical protein
MTDDGVGKNMKFPDGVITRNTGQDLFIIVVSVGNEDAVTRTGRRDEIKVII